MQAEALVARRAVEFALEVGISQAMFEGDSEIVFKDLINHDLSFALHGLIIQDVRLI